MCEAASTKAYYAFLIHTQDQPGSFCVCQLVSSCGICSLPGSVRGRRSFTYEEFISAQEKFQKSQAEALAVRNGEVARAIEDVITLVQVRE